MRSEETRLEHESADLFEVVDDLDRLNGRAPNQDARADSRVRDIVPAVWPVVDRVPAAPSDPSLQSDGRNEAPTP